MRISRLKRLRESFGHARLDVVRRALEHGKHALAAPVADRALEVAPRGGARRGARPRPDAAPVSTCSMSAASRFPSGVSETCPRDRAR